MLYLCSAFEDALRVKAAAQHSSSELGSAFALHHNCTRKSEMEVFNNLKIKMYERRECN